MTSAFGAKESPQQIEFPESFACAKRQEIMVKVIRQSPTQINMSS